MSRNVTGSVIAELDATFEKGFSWGVSGEELRRKREALGLSQGELAKELQVSRATVNKYEQLKEIPRVVALAIKEIERRHGR